MKSFAPLILVIATIPCAFAVENSAIVKVFTLKGGGAIVAIETRATIGADKTSYDVTQADGKTVSFDNTRVTTVEEMPMADWIKRKPFVLLASPPPDTEIVIGVRKADPKPDTPAVHIVEPFTGPGFGLGPDTERDERDSRSTHGTLRNLPNTQIVTKDGTFTTDPRDGSRTPVTDSAINSGPRSVTNRSNSSRNNASLSDVGSTVISPKSRGTAEHWNARLSAGGSNNGTNHQLCMACHANGIQTGGTTTQNSGSNYYGGGGGTAPSSNGNVLMRDIVMTPGSLYDVGKMNEYLAKNPDAKVPGKLTAPPTQPIKKSSK